jgi:hypothetical protein
MSITIAIILGLIAITAISVAGTVLDTTIKNRAKAGPDVEAIKAELVFVKERLRYLDDRLEDREATIRKLQDEVAFVGRMLEDKGADTRKLSS